MNKSNEFFKAAKPLMDYLAANHHPHMTATVQADKAELFEAHLIIHNGAENEPAQEVLFVDNLGTSEQAIAFAILETTDSSGIEFLEAWTHGDVSEWPEYQEFIAKEKA